MPGISSTLTIKQDNAKFEGTWVVQKIVDSGQEPEEPPKETRTYTFKDGNMIIKHGDDDKVRTEVPYEIDPTKSPKTIDFAFPAKDPTDNSTMKKSPGIYKFDGETLIVSRTAWGFPRPKGFNPAARAVVLTMKKQAPKP